MLKRRSLFAGVAALPALVPAVVADRPFATGGVLKSKPLHVVVDLTTEAIFPLGRYREWRLPSKHDVRGLFAAIDVAVKPVAASAAEDIDDREFGLEG